LKTTVIEAQAPNREKVFEGYALDPDLLWTRKDYPRTLNLAMDRAPDILFLGDSCTEFGDYDRRFARLVAERFPPLRLESANFGCAGWSTFQGRRQMERDVTRVRPRIVTLYFGWNDHWLSVGVDDAGVSRLNESPLYRLSGLRLTQLLMKGRVALAARAGGPPPRVNEADFRANLVAMVRTARETGAEPVILTAPTPGRENEGRWTGSLAVFPAIHRRYADIAREVAAAEKVILCDLAAEFDRIPPGELRARYFFKDEVHLTDTGNQLIAETLVGCFEKQGLLGVEGAVKRAGR
jgi:lysophospholipase L1-like esterase